MQVADVDPRRPGPRRERAGGLLVHHQARTLDSQRHLFQGARQLLRENQDLRNYVTLLETGQAMPQEY